MLCQLTDFVRCDGSEGQRHGVPPNNAQTVWCTTGITGTDLALLKQTGASAWDALSLDSGWRVKYPAHTLSGKIPVFNSDIIQKHCFEGAAVIGSGRRHHQTDFKCALTLTKMDQVDPNPVQW